MPNYLIALAGNPNTGKSTIFNALTGLRQHTGNWPGKTVIKKEGSFSDKSRQYKIVDLPGAYSLLSDSADETVSRDFILFGQADLMVIVVDSTCLERNLSLVFQILEITDRAVVCLNLMDEAERKGIVIDSEQLASELGVPVIPTVAHSGRGLERLLQTISDIITGKIKTKPFRHFSWFNWFNWDNRDNHDNDNPDGADLDAEKEKRYYEYEDIVSSMYSYASKVGSKVSRVVAYKRNRAFNWDRILDEVFTSRLFGFLTMFLLLSLVFYLTIKGANIPSRLLSSALFWVEGRLAVLFRILGAPEWLEGFWVHGVYQASAWVVSVMLPPMAIFFPIFTILEDVGYLPRVVFNLDRFFKWAGAHGKQALTMCMGFGCNAAGVTACRIIDSPRERLIAILTNNFVPCNGRWPTIIILATLFVATAFPAELASIAAASTVVGVTLFGILTTFLVSAFLSRTWLRGSPSSFQLEMPPYRKPKILRILYTSLIDRTLFVLGRAVTMAMPAGALIWTLGNVSVDGLSLMSHLSGFLEPLGRTMGLDGVILLAYIVAIPANEIIVPTIIMGYMSTSHMTEVVDVSQLKTLFEMNGWTLLTAICLMLFSLLHYPCSTTTWTIWKETRSRKWTLLSNLLPLLIAFLVTFTVAQIWNLLGMKL